MTECNPPPLEYLHHHHRQDIDIKPCFNPHSPSQNIDIISSQTGKNNKNEIHGELCKIRSNNYNAALVASPATSN
ncbi:hypothetical protein GE061_009982 [Apolygus lucorum]|uniref:Uncharacterized protein n=1 Tax=Apolygus lucorum TaxID=248454 RepID=A0A8S9Y1T5_APOLU|nr:hypothetical protein GE061_009982 [Apolygus lucorum]